MGRLHIRINELLEERGLSKNTICKDLDLPRGNFNRYCRDDFQRIDAMATYAFYAVTIAIFRSRGA